MKYLLILLLFVGHSYGQKLEITKLTDDFYIFTTYKTFEGKPFPSNGMYVVTEKGVIIIDSPWDVTQGKPLLDSIQKKHGKKVMHAIATHYHEDRTGAFDFFKKNGIMTWSTYRTHQLCKEHGEQQSQLQFSDETTWDFGSHTLRMYWPGEGHTKDNIVIWFEKQKILYGGCLVKSTDNTSLGNIADANLKDWPKSIEKIIEQFPNPSYVIPGHFGWSDNRALQHTLDLLKQ